MPYADWAGATRDLLSALQHLTDREFLIMGERTPVSGARRGIFDRRPRPVSTRYVQALRIDELLSAECVGATSLGGTWEMDDVTIAHLCAMGWLTPEQAWAEHGCTTPNFEVYVEATGSSDLAELMVASLAVLGAHPAMLVLQASTVTLRAAGG